MLILPSFWHFNPPPRGLKNATQITKHSRVFIVKPLSMTFSFLILSWAVSDEFTAPFGIFGLTLTVMLVKGLIQRFYLNNLTNLLIKALREKMIGRLLFQTLKCVFSETSTWKLASIWSPDVISSKNFFAWIKIFSF